MRRVLFAFVLAASAVCPFTVAVSQSDLRVAPVTATATEDGEEKEGWIALACDLCDCCQWFEAFF